MDDLTTTTVDFGFENHGSVVLIRALSDAAKEKADDMFPDAQMLGDAYACEPRFAPDIAADLYFEQGFTVTVDGRLCDAQRGKG